MVKNFNILFRTSGGKAAKKELGMGHIFRTMNLASCFNAQNLFFLIEDYGNVKRLLKTRRFQNIITMKKNSSLSYDIKKTKNVVVRKKIDVVIVDKFQTNKKYITELRKFTKVVVVSDLEIIEYPADLVVNGYVGFSNRIHKNRFNTKCLLGPKFQILNKSCTKINSGEKKFTLLATFGGYDEHDIVSIFCKSIEPFVEKIKTKVILGPATKKNSRLRSFEKKYSTFFTVQKETKDMCKEISNSKFGICSGGITSYEFAVKNVPFAIVCQHTHQLKTANQWDKKKIAINLGMPNDKICNKIQKFLYMVIENSLRKTNHHLLDGLGAMRVSKEILKILD